MDFGTLASERGGSAVLTHSATPLLHIPAGTCFGYRAGPFWARRTHILVRVEEAVETGPGLHLLVAPNGVGKTTLLRGLAGLARPLQGTPTRHGVVRYFADELRSDPELKARAIFRAWFGGGALALAETLAAELRLSLTTPAGKLSRGNRQKILLILAEVQARLGGPALLLMDEPLTGLDAETRAQVLDMWAGAGAGAMRLVITHELEAVKEADSLLTIAGGRLLRTTQRVGGSWLETYRALQAS